MRCSKVYKTLDGISRGTELRYTYMADLLHLGLIKRVPAIEDSTAEVEDLKRELYDVKRAIASFKKGGARDAGGQEGPTIHELMNQEIDLRRRILDGVQNMRPTGIVRTSEGDVTLTYKGMETLQLLEARLPAAGEWEWETLAGNLEKLCDLLSREAEEASFILKKISPRLKNIDEYLLRSAAVGLASIGGDAEKKAWRFIDHVREFKELLGSDDTYVVLGAEEAVLHEMLNQVQDWDASGDFLTLVSELSHSRMFASEKTITDPEAKAIATLLMSRPPDERSELLSRIRGETPLMGDALGTALIVLESTRGSEIETSRHMYRSWMRRLRKSSRGGRMDAIDAVVASALMATATGDQTVLEEKFNRARAYMKSLFQENMFAVSAAIAIWPTTIEESFDNIRLAASQILLKKLSVGGVENFSLGIKLLTNNADFVRTGMGSALGVGKDLESAGGTRISGAMIQAVGASAVAILASPLLSRTPFTVFHAITVQKNAVQDFRYHPVHTSYLYG